MCHGLGCANCQDQIDIAVTGKLHNFSSHLNRNCRKKHGALCIRQTSLMHEMWRRLKDDQYKWEMSNPSPAWPCQASKRLCLLARQNKSWIQTKETVVKFEAVGGMYVTDCHSQAESNHILKCSSGNSSTNPAPCHHSSSTPPPRVSNPCPANRISALKSPSSAGVRVKLPRGGML